jgi:phosphatidate cytidylyltransferase
MSRTSIACFLFTLLFLVTLLQIYRLFFICLLVASMFEIFLVQAPSKLYQTVYAILPLKLLLEIQSFSQEELQYVFFILLFNSVSDIMQYLGGKCIGSTPIFSFTEKTIEGYACGIFLTPILFTFIMPMKEYEICAYLLMNVLGMFGGILSSLIKRNCKCKHWSNLLGPHGGINDRIDSWMLPIFVYCKLLR